VRLGKAHGGAAQAHGYHISTARRGVAVADGVGEGIPTSGTYVLLTTVPLRWNSTMLVDTNSICIKNPLFTSIRSGQLNNGDHRVRTQFVRG